MNNGVQIIPFAGPPLDFNFKGWTAGRFPSSEHGFLIGEENKLLEPLIQKILDGCIARERQPILLYGETGTGRTHLLKGLWEVWRKNQPRETLRRLAYYSTCADFTRQFSESIAVRTTDAFRRRYCKAKLLLLDDLEQLYGKPAAQKELRLILDSFEDGVIVLTAQTLPKLGIIGQCDGMSADLAERVQSGTAIPISLPGESVRYRVLRDLASALRIPLTEAHLKTAARTLTGTIPHIYGIVAQAYLENKTSGEPLRLDFWQQFSSKHQESRRGELPVLTRRTARYFSLKISDLKGPARNKTIVFARSIAVYLAKTKLNLTFKEIGLFFGKRDPSSIRYLVEKIDRALAENPEIQEHLAALEKISEQPPH